jgi:hypothetical protein
LLAGPVAAAHFAGLSGGADHLLVATAAGLVAVEVAGAFEAAAAAAQADVATAVVVRRWLDGAAPLSSQAVAADTRAADACASSPASRIIRR